MKKLLEIQDQYIAALKREVSKPIELLTAAKYAASNNISACTIEGCTAEKRCNFCKAWSEVWTDIDAYLKDNRS
jgi:hypothetical protein